MLSFWSRFPPLPQCGAYPIVGYCVVHFSINYFRQQNSLTLCVLCVGSVSVVHCRRVCMVVCESVVSALLVCAGVPLVHSQIKLLSKKVMLKKMRH